MTSTMPPNAITPSAGSPAASVLAARVARDLAVLVRVEVEAAAFGHAERLRRPAKDLLRLLAAGASVVFALGFGSWAALRALDATARPWLAALLIGAGWLVLAGLLSVGSRREFRRWRNADLHAEHLEARARAEADARTSLEALFDRLADELVRHEERRLTHAAGTEIETVERRLGTALESEADELETRAAGALEALLEIVTLPGRAGIDALRRLAH
jgi:hypothetical protein